MRRSCHRLLSHRIGISTQHGYFIQSPIKRRNHVDSRTYRLDFKANGPVKENLWRRRQLLGGVDERPWLPDAQRLIGMLQERPWLRSVKVFCSEPDLLNGQIPEQNISVSEQLQKLSNLEEFYLCASHTASTIDYPPFHLLPNLKSISVHEIPTWDYTYAWEIPRVCRALPNLKHLGLSWQFVSPDIEVELYQIASQFRLLSIAPLQLESLHLGVGAMPWWGHAVDRETGNFPPGDNYLREILDVSYLKSLRLDNFNRYNLEYLWCGPYLPIITSMFTNAKNLESLTVDRLGPDIVQLIQLVQESQAQSPKLDTLRVLRYGSTLQSQHSEWISKNCDWEVSMPGDPIFSVPLAEVGHDWRRLCYSGFPISYQTPECLDMAMEQLRSVAKCTRLVELAVPIHRRNELEVLKKEVLPNLRHLQVLHLPWSMLADFITEWDDDCPKDAELGRSEEGENESEQKEEARKLVQAKRKFLLVRELFEWHEHLRTQQPDMSPLTYIAIDEEAYTRLPKAAGEKKAFVENDLWVLSDGSTIKQLEEEEAREIGIIDILYHYRLSDLEREHPV